MFLMEFIRTTPAFLLERPHLLLALFIVYAIVFLAGTWRLGKIKPKEIGIVWPSARENFFRQRLLCWVRSALRLPRQPPTESRTADRSE